ncbi:MAG: glucose-6-phosphate isomerase [Alphaproteobacteria bacterium]|nr:glucose-6-phosphate isomerase [Alphaproteobacteria bacterium]
MTFDRSAHLTLLTEFSQRDPVTAKDISARLDDAAQQARLIHQLDDLTVDFSRQSVREDELEALITWGESILPQRDAMLAGEVINLSETRPVLHTRLRDPDAPEAQENIAAMAAMAQRILALGVEDVVAIGTGGSHLGPATVVKALSPFHQGPDIHFVSNLDPSDLDDTLAMLNPVTTAVITVSKTFTTKEPRFNMAAARAWFDKNGVDSASRIYAVTACPGIAEEAGIPAEQILTMDEGIGGRFSLWSAVGLSIMVAIGEEMFIDLIAGAEQMDKHFASAPVEANMPILGALIQVWNRAFLGHAALAMIPYDQRLVGLPAWLQQLVMESNGKSLTIDGRPVDLAASPIVIGEPGSNAQHSFFQMIHQSNEITPVDFIAPLTPISLTGDHDETSTMTRHRDLIAQMLAQADCLALGNLANGADGTIPLSGGRPSTIITWQATTPFALGRMLAYYEHLTVVCGWLLRINSFDQPGVELGKTIARGYVNYMDDADSSEAIPCNSKTYLDLYKN